jgi:small subunit ribosomal protein S16
MLKIRLQRVGRKAEPVFRLVLTDSKNSTKSGKTLENLGNYDARRGEQTVLKADRISHWIAKGAQASGTVHNLLVQNKIINSKKINVLPLKKAIVKEVPAEAAPAPVAETPKAEEAPIVEEVVETPAPEVVAEAPTEPTA